MRYYACESMYNIAKVAKGEVLLFFNDVFDALCKVGQSSKSKPTSGADQAKSLPLTQSYR